VQPVVTLVLDSLDQSSQDVFDMRQLLQQQQIRVPSDGGQTSR
jgi:hypothetical protein